MKVITDSEARTITTPNGVVTTLAAPSQGSDELSSWRIQMNPGAEGPAHIIDREQVFMPLTGSFVITMDGGQTATVARGQAAVLPAGVVRQIRVDEGPAEALVCMPVGGQVSVPGSDDRRPLPWAQ